MAWKKRRDDFMRKFNAKDAATLKGAWRATTSSASCPDGSTPAQHLHKLRLAEPLDKLEPRGGKGRPDSPG